MDISTGSETDDFLARRGAIHAPARQPRPRAFDCDDTDDTFRGRLRDAVDCIKPDVLTSLCAYRIGFEGSTTELSLLVTVLPGSLTPSEAVQAIIKLSAVLESYDKRLGDIAIEVAEQTIFLADGGQTEAETSPGKKPSEEVKSMSYGASPPTGSSIGLADDQQGAGTLGAFLRIVTDGTAQYFGLTCSHVLSSSKMPTEPGRDVSSVVCPADRDNLHWWLAAENIIRFRSTAFARVQEAQAQKLHCMTFQRTAGAMYASSGLRASLLDHWVLDWALIKLDPARFTFEQLHNFPSQSSCERFEVDLSGDDWKETDWKRRTTYAAAAKGSRVFKIGRTTGHTAGRLHDIDSSVTIGYTVDRPHGKRNVLVKGKALVVHPGNSRFADCGDSGALVLNGHIEAVGIVTAVANGSVASGAVYVSPFEAVIDDIKEILQRGPVGKVQVELL
ncbi:hypothetical protein MFIFM68171_02848 [Madurella fahalii]|uniref:Peptidase S1 domain-containing protein n=1 Tax=Madurella fahalii TaxID=1157608 RepID=A0ABQ0G4F3_9PEZI